jgi:hypothetical protein
VTQMTPSDRRQTPRHRAGLAVLFTLLITSRTAWVSAQTVNVDEGRLTSDSQGTQLIVDSGRPVARAIRTLILQYGYVITYEDPRYEHDDDFADVASTVRKDYSEYPTGRAPKILVPRVGHLALRFTPPSNGTDMAGILDRVISEQAKSNHGGHFQLIRSGDTFHVVPREVRDRKGSWQSETSILAVPISIAIVNSSEEQMFQAIASQVALASHTMVVALVDGGVQIGASNEPVYSLSADNKPATEVLMRALKMTNTKRTWFLYHGDVGSSVKRYTLNILTIPERQNESSNSGPKVIRPAPTGSQTPAVSPIP